MRQKTFDCVKMQRKGALRIYEDTKAMTFEEKVQYWRRKSDEALRRHAQLKRDHAGKTIGSRPSR